MVFLEGRLGEPRSLSDRDPPFHDSDSDIDRDPLSHDSAEITTSSWNRARGAGGRIIVRR
jgi:hypothetical protein